MTVGGTSHYSSVGREKHTSGVSIPLVIRFIATSFLYLFVGLLIFAVDFTGFWYIDHDAIDMLWLFGFVVMIVFGLSYMFTSGLARNSGFISNTVSTEYILLNAGIIIFFIGYTDLISTVIYSYLSASGIILIMIAVLLHIMNLLLIGKSQRDRPASGKISYADDY